MVSALGAPTADVQLADQAAASSAAKESVSTAVAEELSRGKSADGQSAGESDSDVVVEADSAAEAGESEAAASSKAGSGASAGDESSAADESSEAEENVKNWYILKVQVNREDSIRDALIRRIKILGLEHYVGEIVVPTEDVAEFNKSGKRRIVKRKLYPGYLLVNMAINDETWFLIRETPGVGDFTGSAGRPTPMEARDVERILRLAAPEEEGGGQVKTAIPFTSGDRVRVKDGYFQNFEGEVAVIDHANGRITVMINIFGRSTPVELEHWQVESV